MLTALRKSFISCLSKRALETPAQNVYSRITEEFVLPGKVKQLLRKESQIPPAKPQVALADLRIAIIFT
jgi:hypothetical protein